MSEDKSNEQLLRDRWKGEEGRIGKIVESARKEKYEDWTVHLEGLPYIDEIEPVFDERYGRDLRGIRLTKADLTDADFRNADLRWADFYKAELKEVNLSGAKLNNATLQEGKLRGAILHGAELKDALLSDAKLENAILHEANLTRAHFNGANLSGAQFDKTTLVKTDLSRVKLTGANLRGIDLERTIFRDTSLREADLQDANLKGAKGLLPEQLAGANVCNAKLPEDIQRFDVLEHVGESSSNARKIFLTMLLGCVYSWLTIATTTDPRLLTNSASSPLPIIGTEIPIVYFYVAAPLLLFGFYIYFHLYMQRLWESLAKLPAIFPDGRPLDERIYPWLLTGLVRSHFRRLRDKRPAFSRLQAGISILLAWWFVPLTIFFFWTRYLKRHGWFGTSLHILLLGLSIFIGIVFYHRGVESLRGEKWRIRFWKIILWSSLGCILALVAPQLDYWFVLQRKCQWDVAKILLNVSAVTAIFGSVAFCLFEYAVRGYKSQKWRERTLLGFSTVSFAVCLLIHSYGAIYGIPGVDNPVRPGKKRQNISIVLQGWARDKLKSCWIISTGPAVSSWARANFEEQDVSIRLQDWTEDKLYRVEKAKLRGANLIYCLAYNAFLVYADLRRADLNEADLNEADLRWADLSHADLSDADLIFADLRGADLRGADFRWASLCGAKLNHAKLGDAKLNEADLRWAVLDGAYLRGVKLRGADLYGADLSHANITDYIKPITEQVDTLDLPDAIDLLREQIESAFIDENTKLPKPLEQFQKEILEKQKKSDKAIQPQDNNKPSLFEWIPCFVFLIIGAILLFLERQWRFM